MSDLLQQLQLDVAGYLAACKDLEYVPVFVENPRTEDGATTVVDRINQHLIGITDKGGKSGLGIMVMRPKARSRNADAPGPQFIAVVELEVIEHIPTNESSTGTGITASEMALTVANLLHYFRPDRSNQLRVAPNFLDPVDAGPDYDARIITLERHDGLAAPNRIAAPVLTNGSGQFTPEASTSARNVYYTTDGDFPNSTNGTLSNGSAVVTATGTVARAVAYPTNAALAADSTLVPSQVVEVVVG